MSALLVVTIADVIDVIINTYTQPENIWPSLVETTLLSGMMAAFFIAIAAQANHRLYTAQQEFERLSRTDVQTGLLNRRGFFDEAGRPGANHARSVLLIIDIDYFKRINDQFGHLVGDAVIAAVGDALNDDLFSPRLCGRVGGEEFAVIISDVEPGRALRHADHLRWRIMKGVAARALPPGRVTVSIGVCPIGNYPVMEAYAQADRALFIAKRSGRNCCVMAEGAFETVAERAGELAESA